MNIEAPWAKLPLHILNDPSLSTGDMRVYCALDFLAGKRGWWYGPVAEIVNLAGVSRPTALRSIDRLRTKDYIATQKMGIRYGNVLRYLVEARVIADPVFENDTGTGIVDDTGTGIADDTGTGIAGDTDTTTDLNHRRTPQSSAAKKRSVTPVCHPGPREQALATLANSTFMASMRQRFPGLDHEYQGEKWVDHVEVRPPKSNYKNAYRNWCERIPGAEKPAAADEYLPADYDFEAEARREWKEYEQRKNAQSASLVTSRLRPA